MFYLAWVVGVLLAILASVMITIRIEKSGKFDE
ncbi:MULTISPECIES: cytochrome bd oxidase small subunit, CydX/CbdX family [Basfia]|uniref:YbgT protein n=1 Tax=Mannheimia succiniciproducens (strain KCTC 0769BP / MBEL55E) TaxID=221988 RepID=Q65UN6_MANSM|nr:MULTISPECIES: cytochrome bd oxidase small subunit, CydX/CbdX family [Basfia]AAU37324.1 unknown [[Mannheimia] succiniciproducens MBEL55E]